MYLASDGEVNPIEVMKWCWNNSKQSYVPIVVQEVKNSLLFAEINAQAEFTKNCFNINEPVVARDQIIKAEDLDLVLLPLVAFDQHGNRIGMGGGFYDTTFAFLKNNATEGAIQVKPRLIGIAHEFQQVEEISSEYWDIPLTMVVTDKQIYSFGSL